MPLNGDCLPIEPAFGGILPWSDASWKNFWELFSSFQYSEFIYRRTVWHIFTNMVNNFYVHPKERRMYNKFRFEAAEHRAAFEATIKNDIEKCRKYEQEKAMHEQDDRKDRSGRTDYQALMDLQLLKYGLNESLNGKQASLQQRRDYLNKQRKKYMDVIPKHFLFSNGCTRYNNFETASLRELQENMSLENCLENVVGDVENDLPYKKGVNKELHLVNSEGEFRPKGFQRESIKQLEDIIKIDRSKEGINLKKGQWLAFMQGSPGSGKTATARYLTGKLGLNALFSGTTGTAAAQLLSDTINSVLHFGLNRKNLPENYKRPSSQAKMEIQTALQDIDTIVVDEVSMMTPVTLQRMNLYLQACFPKKNDADETNEKESGCSEKKENTDSDAYLFGGKNILLIGDMYQFPPVQPGLRMPALYQAAVEYSKENISIAENEAYWYGAKLFTYFRKVELTGQVRACPEYNNWLSKLRTDGKKSLTPIDDDWIEKLKPLVLDKDDLLHHHHTLLLPQQYNQAIQQY